MKKILVLILSLLTIKPAIGINYVLFSELYAQSTPEALIDLWKDSPEVTDNLTIIELLLKKSGESYQKTISQDISTKIATLRAFKPAPLSYTLLPEPLPEPIPYHPAPIATSQPFAAASMNIHDPKNLVKIEYILSHEFFDKWTYAELLSNPYKTKYDNAVTFKGTSSFALPSPFVASNSAGALPPIPSSAPRQLPAPVSANAHTSVRPPLPPSPVAAYAAHGGAGAGTDVSQASSATGSTASPVIEKYRQLMRNGASNMVILENLLGEIPGSTIVNRLVPANSPKDINNDELLSWLLENKFNQPAETVKKMRPYFKIVDIKRQLYPHESDIEIPMDRRRSGENPQTRSGEGRSQTFSRHWIEFPNPTKPNRHLDYNKSSASRRVYLMDTNNWNSSTDDYKVIKSYSLIIAYYWANDGETFFLIDENGIGQSYDWEYGEPVGNPINTKVPIVIEEPTVEEVVEEVAVAAPVVPQGFNEQGKAVKVASESEAHFRARLKSKLNTAGTGRVSQTDPTIIVANAIRTLDSRTFNELTDTNIDKLRSLAEDNTEWATGEIESLLNKALADTKVLDRAKLYIIVNSGLVNESDARVHNWKNILDNIELESVRTVDPGIAHKIPFKAVITRNGDAYGQTYSKFSLSVAQQDALNNISSILVNLPKLLKINPDTADNLTKAKIFLVLKSNFIEDGYFSSDLDKWRAYFSV